MKIKRYEAPDVRRALIQIRDELGSDAVILSNKKTDKGVEVTAAVDFDETEVANKAVPAKTQAAPAAPDNRAALEQALKQRAENMNAKPLTSQKKQVVGKSAPSVEPLKVQLPKQAQRFAGQQNTQQIHSGRSVNEQERRSELAQAMQPPKIRGAVAKEPDSIKEMRDEMRNLRGLMENQLSRLAWGDFLRGEAWQIGLLQRLTGVGISAKLSKDIIGKINTSGDPDAAWQECVDQLSSRLRTANDEIMTHGGVVALVGPTGVGKTTTVAKLAARFAMQHGANSVALLTLDNYRVGAHEQLNTYARLLGVPIKAVSDAIELQRVLHGLRDKKLVLIDTAGMSQRDERVLDQVGLLNESGAFIKKHLVVSANSQTQVLNEVIDTYAKNIELDGVILTKMDEATSIGGVVSAVVTNDVPVAYLTDGQQVPEDLHVAKSLQLVEWAITMSQKNNIEEFGEEMLDFVFDHDQADPEMDYA